MTPDVMLVAVDIAGCAEEVVATAAPLARKTGMHAVLAYVVPSSPGLQPDTTIVTPHHPEGVAAGQALHEEARASLERLADIFRDLGVPTRARLVDGLAPAEAVLQLEREERPAMVVLGTHGRTGLRRVLMGSVAETITRHARAPVLTVRSLDPDAHRGPTEAQQQVDAETYG